MASLEEVVDSLVAHSGDIDLAARFVLVDANEIHAALEGADADSADGVVLRLLAKYNPLTEE